MHKQTATLAGREIHFKSLPAVWGRDHQVGAALNLTKGKGAEIIYISLFCFSGSESQRTPSSTALLLGVKKERIPVCPPSVDPDQPHPLSLCDPDRSCPDVRLRHNGGTLTPRLCPSRCGRVCLLLHQNYLHSGT